MIFLLSIVTVAIVLYGWLPARWLPDPYTEEQKEQMLKRYEQQVERWANNYTKVP